MFVIVIKKVTLRQGATKLLSYSLISKLFRTNRYQIVQKTIIAVIDR